MFIKILFSSKIQEKLPLSSFFNGKRKFCVTRLLAVVMATIDGVRYLVLGFVHARLVAESCDETHYAYGCHSRCLRLLSARWCLLFRENWKESCMNRFSRWDHENPLLPPFQSVGDCRSLPGEPLQREGGLEMQLRSSSIYEYQIPREKSRGGM